MKRRAKQPQPEMAEARIGDDRPDCPILEGLLGSTGSGSCH